MRSRTMSHAIALSALVPALVLPATTAEAHAAARWDCWANSYQNDGDAGGRSAFTEYIYANSTTKQVKGEFYALGERLTLRNGTSSPVELRLFNAVSGAQLGYLSAPANDRIGRIKNLDLPEGISVNLRLVMNRVFVCTATGAVT
ncbi:hypothetical protein ACWEPC_25495 [Nonomuraea sp. NPDC004297]